MQKMPYLTTIMSAFALSACATTGAARPLADGSDVALGQYANVDGPIVQPVEVIEDSRCPVNVQCVWAGRVRVKMLWIRPDGNRPFEVTLGDSAPLADGAIRLESVRPANHSDVAIKPADYRFSFRFDGGL